MTETALDLTDRTSWRKARDRSGQEFDDVIESLCGRYTICESTSADGRVTYLAWRRAPTGPGGRWEVPTLLGAEATAGKARRLCRPDAEGT